MEKTQYGYYYMSSEDLIVSVPHYNCEFTMPWLRFRDTPLSEFLREATNMALNAAQPGVRLSRLSDLLMPPPFEIYVPGAGVIPIVAGGVVSDYITLGSIVMILTRSEIATASGEEVGGLAGVGSRPEEVGGLAGARGSQESGLAGVGSRNGGATLPRERLSGIGEMLLVGMLMAGRTSQMTMDGSTVSGALMTPLERINERYRGLLLGSTGAVGQPQPGDDEDDDEEDEEYVGPPFGGNPRPQPQMAGAAGSQLSSGVKKVLNQETFNRVCNVVIPPPPTDESSCTVCLSRLSGEQEIRKMPNCSHTFHSTCLSQWLTQNSITCPVCREPAVTETKDYGYLGFGLHPDQYIPATEVSSSRGVGADPPPPNIPSWLPTFPPGIMTISSASRRPGGIITASSVGTTSTHYRPPHI